jgi:ribosomal protein L19
MSKLSTMKARIASTEQKKANQKRLLEFLEAQKRSFEIECSQISSLSPGDTVTLPVYIPDKRKWPRFKAWVLRRQPPMTKTLQQFTIKGNL